MTKANVLKSVFVRQCRRAGVYRDGQGLMLRVEPTGTKRWVVYDKVRFGIELPKDAKLIHQERAYSSPIWYTPEG